jgi:hypothetical protein
MTKTADTTDIDPRTPIVVGVGQAAVYVTAFGYGNRTKPRHPTRSTR